MVRLFARAHRVWLVATAALTTTLVAAVSSPAFAATSGTLAQPAAVGASSLSGAFNGIQVLLTHLALPAAGVGLAAGGVWHSVAHNQQSQESAKSLMKAAGVGAVVTLLATAILHGLAGAIGA